MKNSSKYIISTLVTTSITLGLTFNWKTDSKDILNLARTRLVKYVNDIEKLSIEKNSCNQQLLKIKSNYNKIISDYAALSKSYKTLHSQSEDLRKEVEVLNSKLEKKNSEYENLKTLKQNLEKEHTNKTFIMTKNYEKLQQILTNTINNNNEKINSYKDAIKDADELRKVIEETDKIYNNIKK